MGRRARQKPARPNVFAEATGSLELFVDGASLGAKASGVLSAFAALPPGEHVIVVRASSGAAAPHVFAEIGGPFGRAGTSARWKARAAVGRGSDGSGYALDPRTRFVFG